MIKANKSKNNVNNFKTVSINNLSHFYGKNENKKKVETEVAGKRVIVEGLVELGPSFGADGNLITSRETFLRLFPANPPGSIEIGLVKLKNQKIMLKILKQSQ